ncbi:MAG: AI-2E family transporter [Spirochaetales bacterium]|nr:AI-2E family transporter [Spirochaetales bacterium]MCF7939940.1 AI-2E family transporter [Spirochaetales bacterium]
MDRPDPFQDNKIITFLLIVITLIGLAFVLYFTRKLFIPLTIAILFSLVLSPLVNRMVKIKIPRGIAIFFVVVIVLGVFFLVGLFVVTSVQSILQEYPKYVERFQTIYSDILSLVNLPEDVLSDFSWADQLRRSLVQISQSFMQFFASLGIIIIFLIFLLLEAPFVHRKVKKAFAGKTNTRVTRVFDNLNRQIVRYLSIKFLASLATGFLVWLFLTLIGQDFAFMWAVLSFIFNFIPNIGSLIVILAASIMGLVQFYPDWIRALLVLVSTSMVNLTIGNLIEPNIQGDRLNLSPFVIILSLIFWGFLWGVIGMILAVPLTAIIKLTCDNIPYLRPVSVIMGSGKQIPRQK